MSQRTYLNILPPLSLLFKYRRTSQSWNNGDQDFFKVSKSKSIIFLCLCMAYVTSGSPPYQLHFHQRNQMAYSSGVYKVSIKTVCTAYCCFLRHLLITGPFYTWKKKFQGKGHLLKKLTPVRYVCSACCNGHTVHFKNTSNGLAEKYTSFIRRQVQTHFLLFLFSGLLK